MSRRPNRIILLIFALLVLTGAVAVLLAAAGLLDLLPPGDLLQEAQASAQRWPLVWAVGLLATGLLLAVLGGWLVRRQLRLRPGGRLDTVTVERTDRGRTTLEAAPVAKAAAADLREVRGVADSNVRLATFGSRPRVIVDLDVDAEASLREVLDRTEEVYERLVHHLGVEGLHVDTVVRPSVAGRRRVQ